MDHDMFASIVYNQLEHCKTVLVEKGKEYSTEDKLHNFRVAAEVQGCSPIVALGGMMAKHTVSIYDMIGDTDNMFGTSPHSDVLWREKITDHINYLLLLWAFIKEQDVEPKVEVTNPLDSQIKFSSVEAAKSVNGG
jgi:hypothetical protein